MKVDQVTGITKLQVHFEAEAPVEICRHAYPLFLTIRQVDEEDNYGGKFAVDLERPGLRVDVFSPSELKWIGEQLLKFQPGKNL